MGGRRDAVASPDGRTILFRVYETLWRMNPDGSGQQELGRGESPAWSRTASGSPSSTRPVTSQRWRLTAVTSGALSEATRPHGRRTDARSPTWKGPSVLIVDADRGEARRIYSTTPVQISSSITWSPDSTRVAFSAPEPHGQTDNIGTEAIVAAPAAGGAPRVLARGQWQPDRQGPRWSPDGKRIAFLRAGRIYTVTESGEQVQQTHPAKGFADGSPAWSPDGQSLAFLRGGGERHVAARGVSGGRAGPA